MYQDNYPCYDVRKIHRQLRRDGHAVARCTLQRLMGELGIVVLVRGKVRRPCGDRRAASGRRRDHEPAARCGRLTDRFRMR
ncbi:IS3 family transposase [Streptosporangium canum]|uniref:IS3 family transposase n=1 Tax=Streptosporangium canum TaxID=324952 RepID=UPI0036BCAEDA